MLGTNLKVLIYDHDVFALHAINSYLAWDRRTRVHHLSTDIEEAFQWLADTPSAEWPDIIILDSYAYHQPASLTALIRRFQAVSPTFHIAIMAHQPDHHLAVAALEAGASAFFMRNDIHIYVASAMIWMVEEERFGISPAFAERLPPETDERLRAAAVMPDRREFPDLTDRIRQAVQLCVVEGMSADLAADEMGVSTHTIRSYIKEGYRILESYDEASEYPPELSPQERAFIRFTSLEEDTDDDQVKE